ncbi:hypothetical protein [Pseudooceanicola nanhaiensis]|uniref:hypothetical protein n=1 Tax=Pseudooceanicola nanhaiensis TaxID=375761 RepID=UPI003511EC4F
MASQSEQIATPPTGAKPSDVTPTKGPWQKYQQGGEKWRNDPTVEAPKGPWTKYQPGTEKWRNNPITGSPAHERLEDFIFDMDKPSSRVDGRSLTAEQLKAAARRAAEDGNIPVARSLIQRAKAAERGELPAPALEEKEPTWFDDLVQGFEATVDTSAMGAQGLARGAANLAGLPVDLVNMSPLLANILPGDQGMQPFSEDPVGGSEWIWNLITAPRDAIQEAAGLEVGDREPTNMRERVVERLGEEIGAAAIPIGGAIGTGARIGVQGAREMGGPVGRFVESAAVDPVRFAAKEGSYAAGAGLGAGGAREMVTDNDPSTDTAAELMADIVGAVGGAGAVAAGRSAGRAATDVAHAFTGQGGAEVVRDAVAGELGRTAGAPLTPSGTPDTGPLADALRSAPSISSAVPGYQQSTADALRNPALAAAEYSRQFGPNSGRFATRRQDNAAAVEGAMDELAPNATPGAFSGASSARRDALAGEARQRLDSAQLAFDQAATRLGNSMSGEARGQTVRAALDDAFAAARQVEREAWSAVRGEADIQPLADAFNAVTDGLTEAQYEMVKDTDNLLRIPERLSPSNGGDEQSRLIASVFGEEMPAAGGAVDLAEVTTLRSSLSDQVRAARTAGQHDRARVLDRYLETIDTFLAKNTAPETAQALRDARRVSFDLNERFTRPGDPVAEAVRRVEGRPRMVDSEVPGRFIQPDSGQASYIDRILGEAKNADDVRNALQDQILSDVRDRKLLEAPDRLEEYLQQYGRVFSRFPDLRSDLGTAAGLRRQLDRAQRRSDSVQKTFFTPNGSTVARYLSFGDERSKDAMASVVNARDPAAAADDVLRFVGDDPQAVEGAKAAFWQLMETHSRSRGETTRMIGGDQPWRPAALHRFVTTPKNRAVLERLYRDDPAQLQRIDDLAEALRSVDSRVAGSKAGARPQVSKGNPVLPSVETLGAYAFAHKRGQVGLPFIGLRLASTMARRAILRGRGQQFDQLLDEALLNPEVAEMLLREHNPANVEAMTRWTRAWAGAEAPIFLDLMEKTAPEPAEDDELLEAIGRP